VQRILRRPIVNDEQNKCNSAVQLKHLPTGIVVKCQETRSRAQNREIARREMADRVEALLKGDESRVAKKAREEARKRASRLKKTRRKYRKLAEGKEAVSAEEEKDEGEGKADGSGEGEKG
jgi:protein subunit release factor B